MATVKQVLAAISHDGLLGPNQKRFVVDAIKRAEIWINVSTPMKPRKITNAKNLVTIEEWEAVNGPLIGERLWAWAKIKQLDLRLVQDMIGEFRDEMRAKGKQYADFVMAFQTYLRKGYLSKRLDQCKVAPITVVHTKGISL